MPYCSIDMARRICARLGLVILILGFASSTANAGISTGLRGLLRGALGADLRVDSFALDKSQAAVGDTLRATVGISNGGRAAAASTLLTVWAQYGSSTLTAGAYRLATVRLGTLPPQARITSVSTFPVPNFGRFGAYQIFATVEAQAPEQNRQNNTQAKTLMVVGPAVSDTDPQPVSDPEDSSVPPPPPPPVADSGSTSPPASDPGSSSPPASDPGSSPSPPPAPTPDPGSSSPPPPPPVATPPSFTCDYYASPNGRGSGTTPESPFKIGNFWTVASPGKTLCLLDGAYTGADSMIAPPTGLSGTATAPITIRALHEGKALIDGQFTRPPVYLRNSWWVVEGLNVKNGPCAGSISVVEATRGSAHNTLRRIVAWDSCITANAAVFRFAGKNNLAEDIGAFGTGRKTIITAQSGAGTNFTCRRCWARWEGSTATGPKKVYEPLYNAQGFTCENCIGTASGESMPETYTDAAGNPQTNFTILNTGGYHFIGVNNTADAGDPCSNLKIYGSLFFSRATDSWGSMGRIFQVLNRNCVDIRHTLVFIHPSHPKFGAKAFELTAGDYASPSLFARNLTSVSGGGNKFGPQWTTSGISAGTSMSVVASPWTTTGSGANLCKQWGTNTPLWPWPMNQRIKEATASAGPYVGPCPGCIGGRFARTTTDVTAIVESLLGSIPASCKR